MSQTEAENRQLKPLGRIVSWAQAGVDPAVMGTGPVPAVKKAVSCFSFFLCFGYIFEKASPFLT